MRMASGGYTLVEVMIVLAVTGLLFISAWGLIGGRQQRVQFNEGVRETLTKVQAVISEVNNGYFKNDKYLQCFLTNASDSNLKFPNTYPAQKIGRPYVITGSDKQSIDYEPFCIFFGKAIQFGTDTDSSELVVHTLLANASTSVNSQKVRIDSLRPDYLKNDNILPTAIADFQETSAMPWGIEISKVVNGTDTNHNTIVFIGGFSGAFRPNDTDEQSLEGGSVNVTPISMKTDFAAPTDVAEKYLDNPDEYLDSSQNNVQTFTKTVVCMVGGGQKAGLLFAKGSAGQLTVELEYDPTECA